MERTKVVTYQSCDLCDSEEEAQGKCDICNKYLCRDHHHTYPWADQIYSFCLEHLQLVASIIKQTEIPIGFVVYKLKPEAPSVFLERKWEEHGYGKLWKEEWQLIDYPCCICASYRYGECRIKEDQRKTNAIILVPTGCPLFPLGIVRHT